MYSYVFKELCTDETEDSKLYVVIFSAIVCFKMFVGCEESYTDSNNMSSDTVEKQSDCGSHGELHGNDYHCDSGYQVDPNDPSQCIEE